MTTIPIGFKSFIYRHYIIGERCLTCVFFLLVDIYDFYIFEYVKFKDFIYSIRNSEHRLVKGRFRTDVFKLSYFNRLVDLWNNPPLFIRKYESFAVFKKEATKHYKLTFDLNVTFF